MIKLNLTYQELQNYIIYVQDYYDIILSGFIKYNSEELYFKCVSGEYPELDENDNQINTTIIYNLYKLPKDIKEIFDVRHKDFCDYVGTHWNYVNGERIKDGLKKNGEHNKFYDKYKDVKNPEMKEEWLIGTITIEL